MLKKLFLFALAALFFHGCAGRGEKDRALDEMGRQVSSTKVALEETRARLDELSNKFLLLHEKVEAIKSGTERSSGVVEPPEGLMIVRLGEEGEKGGGIEKKRGLDEKSGRAKSASSVLDPESTYSRGQDLFISGRYKDARKVFEELLKNAPAHALADNALYWIGESYYSERDYEKALLRFKEVLERYPGENKAPDSLLKVGFSYMELNDTERAMESFKTLMSLYPDSDAAGKAGKTLERLSTNKEGER